MSLRRSSEHCFERLVTYWSFQISHIFSSDFVLVTHLAYTWTCVCNEPEIKVRQHSREDIKVIYDPGRCYENLPFYFFFLLFIF